MRLLPKSKPTQHAGTSQFIQPTTMKRSEFLKAVGVASASVVLPLPAACADAPKTNTAPTGKAALPAGTDCVLIPQETRGPYPLDLSKDSTKFRQDITEGRPGMPLTIRLTIVNINDNCRPIANARVDIWQTDKDGVYSGFQQPGANTVGQTFMRGIQLTDSNGQVEFHTVYPGWYNGRATHIHFEVFLNSVLSATSQMAFPEAITEAVYKTPLYAEHGQNSTTNASDGIFSDMSNTQYEMLTITENAATGGYTGTLTVGMNAPKSGVINLEPETGGQFKLQQNSPNPFRGATAFHFNLAQASQVSLEVFDLSGKKVASVYDGGLEAGDHAISWQKSEQLPAGNYLFQLTVSNGSGEFKQSKVMTGL
ncbi:MAG: T9SS C-terminal target domain-containing protein [Chlorobi bacterium CHB2]|nr:T9SS C-terminal target domain-containing protein [Chlorobi bacterium CHB2]